MINISVDNNRQKFSCCIIEQVFELLDAGLPFPYKICGWCNVKDVAEAHINAYEIASASGRYLLAERVAHYSELASILYDMYPSLKVSNK